MATGPEQESLTQGPALSARPGGPGGTASRSWAPESGAKRFGAALTSKGCWEGHQGGVSAGTVCVWGFGDDSQDLGGRGLMRCQHTRSSPLPGILCGAARS